MPRPSHFGGTPEQQPQQPQSEIVYPAMPEVTPAEAALAAEPAGDMYGRLLGDEGLFAQSDAAPVAPAEAAPAAPATPADAEAAPTEPAAGEADAAAPAEKKKRLRNVTGKKWLAAMGIVAAVGFGGNVIADQIVDGDGIFATDSRDTGEAVIQLQENVLNNVEYAAEGMLALTGVAVAGRTLRASGRFVGKGYRKLRPKKNNANEGNDAPAES